MILLKVSPMPIGQTPGFLSRAIRQQLSKGCKASGSVKDVDMCLATDAKERQRSDDAARNDVHKRLQPKASTPEGPTDLSIWRAVRRIRSPSRQPKIIG